MRPVYIGIIVAMLCIGCHRKRRQAIADEVPDLPPDTVVRLVDRCNYQHLSANPAKAKKQLDNIVKELDHLIIQYDKVIKERQATLRKQSSLIDKLK